MAISAQQIKRFGRSALSSHQDITLSLCVIGVLMVLIIPVPSALIDVLLTINISISVVVLLATIYIRRPVEFAVFPSLLLILTLFRLSLNVATTRMILGQAQAGNVINAFGSFVTADNIFVGVVIFAILVVIQFVVITRGATRISEVAARFTLDAMPGKQMGVDSDLNAGLITEDQARARRREIEREADFYGAMDGASKFVRGDAIAGLVITLINIVGGIYVGLVERGLPFAETLRRFTILTIGDGLVSQIPAFIVSIAAAMLVTRSAEKQSLGDELLKQVTGQPVALVLTGAFLALLALTPLPKPPLILLIASCCAGAYLLTQHRHALALEVASAAAKPAAAEKIEKHLSPDPMELTVGYGLIKLVDRKQGGDLLDRITNMRRQIAQELGIVVPPIRIRDDIQLQPNQLRVKLRGFPIGDAGVLPGHLLAIDAGAVTERILGMETVEPAFGLPAVWIEESQRHDAEHRNYTVVEPSSVIATYVTELIKRHADELLTRQEVNRLLDHLRERSGKLVEEVVPDVLKPGEIQRVLQSLLRERVPIRDLEAILEACADVAGRSKDPEILAEYARNALARTLCYQQKADDGRIHCITLDPTLEELIGKGLDRSERGTVLALPPALQTRLVEPIRNQVEEATAAMKGRTPTLLCPPQIRPWVRLMIAHRLPSVAVLSYNEVVRGVEVESHGMVILKNEG
ncbi:MAG: flagellar biosynthesis protein FlhA [Planctomycetes bacterium]|nr:flagellar biosynthesis protein FlhA [Planctomycetota bacterium]